MTLFAADPGGHIERVIILTRWNSHSATARVKRIFRTLSVPVEVHT